jgi:hypothetical protein
MEKRRRNLIAISCKFGYSFCTLIQNSELLIEFGILRNVYFNYSSAMCRNKSLYLCVSLSVYGSTDFCWTLTAFQFLDLFYTVGRTPWTENQPVAMSLLGHRTTSTQNKRTQTSMTQVRIEPTIPEFEGAKTVHGLDRTAIVIDHKQLHSTQKISHLEVLSRMCWIYLEFEKYRE